MEHLNSDDRERMDAVIGNLKVETESFLPVNFDKLAYDRKKNGNFEEIAKFLKDSIDKGYCPYLPKGGGLVIDTQPAQYFKRTSANGFETWTGYLQWALKTRQIQLCADTPEFVEAHTIKNARDAGFDVNVIDGQEPFRYVAGSKSNGNTLCYYNMNQLDNPDAMYDFMQREFFESKSERYNYLKQKYGDKAYSVHTEFKGASEIDQSKAPKPVSLENAIINNASEKEYAAILLGQIFACGKNNVFAQIYPEEQMVLKKGLLRVLDAQLGREQNFSISFVYDDAAKIGREQRFPLSVFGSAVTDAQKKYSGQFRDNFAGRDPGQEKNRDRQGGFTR